MMAGERKPTSAFPYTGGKSRYADWIIDQFPSHNTFVEVFGGSGAVLLSKPRSVNEVYNDLNDDVVQFFDTLRDRPDELAEWLDSTPYSRTLHNRFADDFYAGVRPDDPVERAGRFFFLRYSSWGGKIRERQPFSTTGNIRGYPSESRSVRYDRMVDGLDWFADRLKSVTIECLDYSEAIGTYDSPTTLFYCDPPYVDAHLENTYYLDGDGFDHEEFLRTLDGIDGDFVCSYERLPDAVPDDWWVAEKDVTYTLSRGLGDEKEATERLLMNYDPEGKTDFSSAGQTTLPGGYDD